MIYTLGDLIKVIEGLKEEGLSEDTNVFVPFLEEKSITHVAPRLMVVDLGKNEEELDSSEIKGIILYPAEANYYETEENEPTDNFEEDNLSEE